jgi:hypothetical protein
MYYNYVVFRVFAGDPAAYLFKLTYFENVAGSPAPSFEAFPISDRLSSLAVKNSGSNALSYGNTISLGTDGWVKFMHYPVKPVEYVDRHLGTAFFGGLGRDISGLTEGVPRGGIRESTELSGSFQFPYVTGFAKLREVAVYELAITPAGSHPPLFEECFPRFFDCLAQEALPKTAEMEQILEQMHRDIVPRQPPAWLDSGMFRKVVPAATPLGGYTNTGPVSGLPGFPNASLPVPWGFWPPHVRAWPTWELFEMSKKAIKQGIFPSEVPRVLWDPAWGRIDHQVLGDGNLSVSRAGWPRP